MAFDGGSVAAGSSLYVDTTATTEQASPTFTQVPGCEQFQWSGFDSGVIESTPLEATQKSYFADVPTPGTLQFSLFIDIGNAVHAALLTVPIATHVWNWKFTTSGGEIFRFTGFIKSAGMSSQRGQMNMVPVTVQCTKVYSIA